MAFACGFLETNNQERERERVKGTQEKETNQTHRFHLVLALKREKVERETERGRERRTGEKREITLCGRRRFSLKWRSV